VGFEEAVDHLVLYLAGLVRGLDLQAHLVGVDGLGDLQGEPFMKIAPVLAMVATIPLELVQTVLPRGHPRVDPSPATL
jgi:hypothetical protein